MIQITIKKADLITNQASFETQEEANSWLSELEGQKAFGEPAHTIQQQIEISPAELDEEGNELVPAQFEFQEVLIPASYEVIIEDITEQLAQHVANKEALAFLANTDWKVLRHRDQQELGIATSLTAEEFQDLLQERQMARSAVIN
jgi:hypothetical protein